MSELITTLSSLFTFLITQLGNVATFFTTNTLGILILGISIFGVVANVIIYIINKIK